MTICSVTSCCGDIRTSQSLPVKGVSPHESADTRTSPTNMRKFEHEKVCYAKSFPLKRSALSTAIEELDHNLHATAAFHTSQRFGDTGRGVAVNRLQVIQHAQCSRKHQFHVLIPILVVIRQHGGDFGAARAV